MLQKLIFLWEWFVIVIMIILLSPYILIRITFTLISKGFDRYKQQKFNRDYQAYLLEIEGANFFCYDNRKKGRDYIEKEVIPNLNTKISIIFLDKNTIQNTEYKDQFIFHSVNNFKNFSRFPHLMKVRNGQIIDLSINRLMFACINKEKNIDCLFAEINSFFELNQNPKV